MIALLVAGVPVVVGITLGERPNAIVAVGIATAIVAGVALGSGSASGTDTTPSPQSHRPTVLAAIGSGVSFGAAFVCLSRPGPHTGMWPLVVTMTVGAAILILTSVVSRQYRLLTGRPLLLTVISAVLSVTGNFSMLLAIRGSLLAVVGVIVSLGPAATVLPALFVLREKVNWAQRCGLLLAVAAIVTITAGSHH